MTTSLQRPQPHELAPRFFALAEKYRDDPAAIDALTWIASKCGFVPLSENEVTWPIWWDGENLEGPLAAQWVVQSMPTFDVLDHNGVIRNKGFLQPDQISDTVDKLLKEIPAMKP